MQVEAMNKEFPLLREAHCIPVTAEGFSASLKRFLNWMPDAAPHVDDAPTGSQLWYAYEPGVCFAVHFVGVRLQLTSVFRTRLGGNAAAAVVHALRTLYPYCAGVELQAFDGFAAKAWQAVGFEEVGRQPFEPAYAHPEWNYGQDGKPDLLDLYLPFDQ